MAQDVDPWAKGKQWLSVRAGYARSAATGAADGNLGFGFGYTRIRSIRWSYSAAAQFDILGRYGDSNEIEVPWTIEMTRHFKWNTALRPYLGVGAGLYYHKISGTQADAASLVGGPHLAWGFNLPISDHGLFGLDIRMSVLRPDQQTNPVFGGEAVTGESQSRVVHWGAKVGHSWVF
jgi:outer membrane protein W